MLVWQMQPQMLRDIFDDSGTFASRNSANLLFPTTIVGFSPTNKLWASAMGCGYSQDLFLFHSLAILVSNNDNILFFWHIQRNVFLSIKVLYGLFVTCIKSQVDYFFFCVHYSKRFCQGTHNTFLLRRALWQSFFDMFHSFS